MVRQYPIQMSPADRCYQERGVSVSIAQFARPATWLITNYDTLKFDSSLIAAWSPDVAIADEAQRKPTAATLWRNPEDPTMDTELPQRTRTYRNHHLDSRRWDLYTPQPGDIVVSTAYYKAGTTWTQAIVLTLLDSREPEIANMSDRSPWPDRRV